MKIYKCFVIDITFVCPARNKAEAYRVFQVMAAIEGMNPAWVDLKGIVRK